MPRLMLLKWMGLGNDFIIIDRRKNSINLSKDQIIQLGNRTNEILI